MSKYLGWRFSVGSSGNYLISELTPNNGYKVTWNDGKEQTFYSAEEVEIRFNRKFWIKIGKELEEVIKIQTSGGILEIPKEGLEFSGEKLEYDTTKYPKWAQNLSRLYPTLERVEVTEDNEWLRVILYDPYYGQPEYKITNQEEVKKAIENPDTKEYHLEISFNRKNLREADYEDNISEEVMINLKDYLERKLYEEFWDYIREFRDENNLERSSEDEEDEDVGDEAEERRREERNALEELRDVSIQAAQQGSINLQQAVRITSANSVEEVYDILQGNTGPVGPQGISSPEGLRAALQDQYRHVYYAPRRWEGATYTSGFNEDGTPRL